MVRRSARFGSQPSTEPVVAESGDNADVLVEVSSRRFAIPFECPCCGAAPDAELAIAITSGGAAGRPVARDTAHSLLVPYCRRCITHATRWEAAGIGSAAVMLGGIVGGIVLAITVHIGVGFAALGVAVPLAWLARKLRRDRAIAEQRESCAGPARALAYLGWSGTTSAFDLASHTYAARFAEANPAILANQTPALRKLLDGHRVARLAVPTPAATVTVPPPATAGDWIARIEGTIGTVERRATLGRALDALTDLGERQLCIQAATRLEVAPVVTALADLEPTPKLQRLQRAIDDVRADNIPEALQAAVLFELEGQLRALSPTPFV